MLKGLLKSGVTHDSFHHIPILSPHQIRRADNDLDAGIIRAQPVADKRQLQLTRNTAREQKTAENTLSNCISAVL